MSKWADYSFARPDLAQLKADGVVGVIRYLSPDNQYTHGKILFAPERDLILASGLDLVLDFEDYEGRCNEGAVAGTVDGHTSLVEAMALNYPQGKCIYFSHDTGLYDWQAIENYFRAAKAALGGYYKIGCYGSYDLCTHLESIGLVDHSWQTLAWSNGKRDPQAVIYQDGIQLLGGQADEDIISSSNIDSWKDGPGGLVATPEEIKAIAQETVSEMSAALKRGGLLEDLNADRVMIEEWIDRKIASLHLNLDTTALASAISSKIVLPAGASLTSTEVKQAVKDALKEGVA